MHGVKRSRISAQAAEAKQQKEQAKIEAYVALQEDVLRRKRAKEYDQESLARTTELLDLNPEFYTVWNYRRDILLNGLFPTLSPTEIVKYLTTDLRLTTSYLQVHPKVYWIWNHRKWCLESVPPGPSEKDEWRNECWKMELVLIEKMLDIDARNFHAWGYRRYVLKSLPDSFTPKKTPRDELRYTQKKIEANFSNFSAWHARTKILGGLWEDQTAEIVAEEKDSGEGFQKASLGVWWLNAEFELVRQALWTDPGDQSGWLYHRWLIGSNPDEQILRRELSSTQELNDAEPDMKWCMGALAHYTMLLARLPSMPHDEAEKLRTQAKSLLDRLAQIDSDRKERYRDFARAIN